MSFWGPESGQQLINATNQLRIEQCVQVPAIETPKSNFGKYEERALVMLSQDRRLLQPCSEACSQIGAIVRAPNERTDLRCRKRSLLELPLPASVRRNR